MSVQYLTDYEYAHKRLSYDPETGIFIWKEAGEDAFSSHNGYLVAKAISFGKEAGKFDAHIGYYRVTLRGKKYLSHRVAWLMMTGSWPEYEIDHINGDTKDNRFHNLRDVTHTENVRNAAKRHDNKSGHVGVFWNNRYSSYQAYIRHEKKLIHLGYFNKKDDAIAARIVAEVEYGYHENHGR